MRNKVLLLLFFIANAGWSQDLSKLYERVNPAVVVIFTQEAKLESNAGVTKTITSEGLGSGFMVSDSEIITASHVVDVAEQLKVRFLDGDIRSAKVISTFKTADVALIKLDIPKKYVTTVSFGDSDQIKIGEQVFIVGAPFGYSHSLSSGYISGIIKNKQGNNPFTQAEFIQTDAAINTGNSGGPMFNMKGEVIGVVSQILTKSGGFEGIGFAATANITKNLIANNRTPWLGFDAYPLIGKTKRLFNVPQNSGLLVQRVVFGSILHKMGLQGGDTEVVIDRQKLIIGGDIILAFNEVEFDLTDESLAKLGKLGKNLKSTDPLELKILRNGKIITLKR
ncbi:S1C family serine protease [Aquimarina sp. RZ0]|uniref:S1C family serine protease n=1 Tax=Aquimarina sp. RZ0 TaxID=2607730 RepID=UPI0011F39E02|nr:trypsin-like peptidase domain-containing protein [Aquimarina sp. RZ0]KAA1244455.1 trypsin-like serine protease [Aquimarina sp. RZ0]